MGDKAVGCHLCSQGHTVFPSWYRSPLPNSVSFPSAFSGHWLPFLEAETWLGAAESVLCPHDASDFLLHVFSFLPLQLPNSLRSTGQNHCSTTAEQTGDSGVGQVRPQQQCAGVLFPAGV